tara:strand:- start:7 stop:666 length:660 start_codon:yes stop_codon:yes gene_type:complete
MATRQIVSKNINVASGDYIGKDGEMWIDTNTNLLKISDGATPGGVIVTTDGTSGGAWADITNISNANGPTSVVIGKNAGGAGTNAVAVGEDAGKTTQGTEAVAIGVQAGQTTQSNQAVAIGPYTGKTTQGASAVAVGKSAGETNQGAQSVAIGLSAGKTNQAANSIVINATGGAVENVVEDVFIVKPVRNGGAGALPTGFHAVAYNPTTGEFAYYGSAG